MASSIIHMCIAKEVNKTLKIKDVNMLLLGSIAPDISKHLGQSKIKSHFLTDGVNIDIESFLKKYSNQLHNPFIMGYYIHLYTDLLWDKYFITEIVENETIHLLDGKNINNDPALYTELIYNDYTNLNVQLIDEYSLDLSLFYNNAVLPDIEMTEIPVSKLPILIDYTGIVIQNTKENKAYTFDLEQIKTFIKTSSYLITNTIMNTFDN